MQPIASSLSKVLRCNMRVIFLHTYFPVCVATRVRTEDEIEKQGHMVFILYDN